MSDKSDYNEYLPEENTANLLSPLNIPDFPSPSNLLNDKPKPTIEYELYVAVESAKIHTLIAKAQSPKPKAQSDAKACLLDDE
ncbi:hypothetical protein [Psychrobacter frigidicola]|uniref:hypothetical protein n=1 Tax=Psychrobacter frigidicola TaxID=45611 RepID=UPI001917D61C|nr:hypothetical protein [Psychrobacter frigidicola]